MGRGRVQLKRIENKINRQVTFSKRRNGLLKKAHEISVLCDAEVALIIFSNRGKLCEYATDSGMARILERYERDSYAARQLTATDPESEGGWCLEYGKLKARVEALQKSHRLFMGEDLDSLSLKELQYLEQQLDAALKHVRSQKNQLMYDSIAELQKKEKALRENNNTLEKKLHEKEKMARAQQSHWDQQNQHQTSSPPLLLSRTLPTLNIGNSYDPASGLETEEESARSRPQSNSIMPAWLLRTGNE